MDFFSMDNGFVLLLLGLVLWLIFYLWANDDYFM
jgi:hypothetical protein